MFQSTVKPLYRVRLAKNVVLVAGKLFTNHLYFFVSGVSTLFMFLVPLTVNMFNFSPRYRGLIVGTTGASWWLGSAINSAIYNALFQGGNVCGYFLLLAILTVVINVLCVWLVVPVDPTPEEATEWQSLVPDTVMKSSDSDTEEDSFSDRYGFNLLWNPEFHLVTWGFLLGGCIQLSYIPNVTAMSNSYHLSYLDNVLTVASPVCACLVKFLAGSLSDKSKSCCPRLTYAVVMVLAQFILLTASIFHGDNETLFVTTTIFMYMVNGTYWAIIPTVLSEYFGMRHFCRNWGFEFFANALLMFVVLAAVGNMYENNITTDSTDCYGLVCYEGFYILGSVCAALSFMLFLWLVVREKSGYKSMKN